MVHEETPDHIRLLEIGMEHAARIDYERALNDTATELQAVVQLTTNDPALSPITSGFQSNILRALHPLGVPIYTVYWASRAQALECQSHFAITGNPSLVETADEAIRNKCKAETLRLHHEWARETFSGSDVIPAADIIHAQNAVSLMISHGSKVATGLVAMLANATTNVWTVFETLSGDLWEAAINSNPQELAKLGGKPKGEKDADKSVPLSSVHRHNYDLSRVMGTLLKEKYNFGKLRDIKRAYRDAFGWDRARIDQLMPKEIDTLEAVRNLLLHRAGIIDEKFLARVKNDGKFSGLQARQELFIDGEMVAGFCNAAIKSGIGLLRAVDERLLAHSPDP